MKENINRQYYSTSSFFISLAVLAVTAGFISLSILNRIDDSDDISVSEETSNARAFGFEAIGVRNSLIDTSQVTTQAAGQLEVVDCTNSYSDAFTNFSNPYWFDLFGESSINGDQQLEVNYSNVSQNTSGVLFLRQIEGNFEIEVDIYNPTLSTNGVVDAGLMVYDVTENAGVGDTVVSAGMRSNNGLTTVESSELAYIDASARSTLNQTRPTSNTFVTIKFERVGNEGRLYYKESGSYKLLGVTASFTNPNARILLFSETFAGTSTYNATAQFDNFSLTCVNPELPATQTYVYRFFNKVNGAHVYTSALNERDNIFTNLQDTFVFEGAKYAVFKEQVPGSVPVYRFYNPDNGAHVYTTAENEKKDIERDLPSFDYEGIKYYVYPTAEEGTNAVHRFFNTTNGAHIYTDAENEKKNIDTYPDFVYEGIKYYVFPL